MGIISPVRAHQYAKYLNCILGIGREHINMRNCFFLRQFDVDFIYIAVLHNVSRVGAFV